MIYLISNEFRNAVKIGYADTLTGCKRRAYHFQIANVDRLRILVVIDGTQTEEHRLHRMFKRFRRRGEWFHDCEEIRAYFAQHHNFYTSPKRISKLPKVLDEYTRWLDEQKKMKVLYGETVKMCIRFPIGIFKPDIDAPPLQKYARRSLDKLSRMIDDQLSAGQAAIDRQLAELEQLAKSIASQMVQ